MKNFFEDLRKVFATKQLCTKPNMKLKYLAADLQASLNHFLVKPPQARVEEGAIQCDAFTISEIKMPRRTIGGERLMDAYQLDVLEIMRGCDDCPDMDSPVELLQSQNFNAIIKCLILTYLGRMIDNHHETEGLALSMSEDQGTPPVLFRDLEIGDTFSIGHGSTIYKKTGDGEYENGKGAKFIDEPGIVWERKHGG